MKSKVCSQKKTGGVVVHGPLIFHINACLQSWGICGKGVRAEVIGLKMKKKNMEAWRGKAQHRLRCIVVNVGIEFLSRKPWAVLLNLF